MRYAQLVMGPAGSGKVGIVKNMGSRLCCSKIVLALYVRGPVLIVKDRCATNVDLQTCRLAKQGKPCCGMLLLSPYA